MRLLTSPEPTLAGTYGRASVLDRNRRKSSLLIAVLLLLIIAPSCSSPGSEDEPTPFRLEVTPTEVADSAPGQRVVLLVTIEDTDEGSDEGEAVELTVTAPGADVIVEPTENVEPGAVAEVTIIPSEELVAGGTGKSVPVGLQPEPIATISVEIVGERAGLTETITVPVGVGPADDFPLEMAEQMRDVFIPWLAENHPELDITAETEWTATPTKPHWLVVSHYLFYSERWEMGVRWHVMIAPFNWAEIYLRERFVEVEPSLGFKVDSVSDDPTAIYPVDIVEPVWR